MSIFSITVLKSELICYLRQCCIHLPWVMSFTGHWQRISPGLSKMSIISSGIWEWGPLNFVCIVEPCVNTVACLVFWNIPILSVEIFYSEYYFDLKVEKGIQLYFCCFWNCYKLTKNVWVSKATVLTLLIRRYSKVILVLK